MITFGTIICLVSVVLLIYKSVMHEIAAYAELDVVGAGSAETRKPVEQNRGAYKPYQEFTDSVIQERLAEIEQQRQLAEIRRAEQEQSKEAREQSKRAKQRAEFKFKAEQAAKDLEHWTEQWQALNALLDCAELEQTGTTRGSSIDIKCQKRIITLTNQIHAAEARIAKARHTKEQAELALSA